MLTTDYTNIGHKQNALREAAYNVQNRGNKHGKPILYQNLLYGKSFRAVHPPKYRAF